MGVEAKELARDIQSAAGSYESNPEKLEQLNQRFSALQLLLRKHGCNTSLELMDKFALLQQGQVGENHLEAEITEIEVQISVLFKQMELEARDLHGIRQAAKDALSKRVVEQLHQLEMPFAQMEVLVELMGENYNEYGNSKVAIHFSANKGQHPMPIEKVASGGEISRLNFCLRTIIAELKQLPTLIYDEADTGVSGEVASRLGYLMRKQGGKQQILAITHLPQVACSGNQQLFVYKNNEADISETQIKTLDENGRIVAIAEMLSGKNPSEAALLNAKNLLEIQSA
jgi:DNA repair protein RecN (Recombination protein N)